MEPLRKIQSVRDAENRFDLYASGILHDEYADGVTGTQITSSITKLYYFCVLPPFQVPQEADRSPGDADVQARLHTLQVTMPTVALLAFCFNTLKALKDRRPSLAAGTEGDRDRMLKIIDQVSFEAPES